NVIAFDLLRTMSTQNKSIQTAALLLWTLLPCPAIWVGLHVLKSAVGAFALYHGVCLLPAIICGRKLWLDDWTLPKLNEWVKLLLASIVFSTIAYFFYELLGKKLLSNEHVFELLKSLGFSKSLFWPLSIYAVLVNPLVEELFWRGVVFNYLDKLNKPFKNFALLWSSFAYALFHYTIFRMVMYPVFAEIGTAMLAIYGALLALLYRKTGSIITTAVAHGLLTDMAAIVLIIALLRHFPSVL
ncbi:MAG: CPBP family intramembrane metalloprotease, partial [Candidatus Obscuribacterales bacterium]|nr:CPBP family intramembrane metalloprotease [Candidatus Obscuribacterales bacterium]